MHDLNGARQRFAESPNLLFLWEKFTTDFLVQLDEFRRIDEVLPPWPCFMIAARRSVVQEKEQALGRLLHVIRDSARSLMAAEDAVSMVAERYDLSESKANAWWQTVEWELEPEVDQKALIRVAETMHRIGVLNEVPSAPVLESIVHRFPTLDSSPIT